jgi:hypothetical protein
MMVTLVKNISGWFDTGVARGASHMLIVCDTFDQNDYPFYVQPGEDPQEKEIEFNRNEMTIVMECYVLDPSRKLAQLIEDRAFHYDAYTPSPTPPAKR